MEEQEKTFQALPDEEKVEEVTPDACEDNDEKDNDDEGGSVLGGLILLVIVGVVIWLLFHFNPSEEVHKEKIAENVTEQVKEAAMDGYTLSPSTVRSLKRIKYHSLGVCSWTSTRQGGKTVVTSIGVAGWVYCNI